MALDWIHLPAMAGDRTGVAFWSETGRENVTEMVALAGTPCAPEVGYVALSTRSDAEDAPEPDPREADRDAPLEVSAESGCVGGDDPPVRSSTAATITAAPARSTQGRRRNGLPALVSRTFMASARSRRVRRLGPDVFQRMGPIPRKCVRGERNSGRRVVLRIPGDPPVG